MEIRTFVSSDGPLMMDLAVEAGKDSLTGSLWGDPESEAAVYLTPYYTLEPESFFVAVVDGSLAGYLAASLGTAVPSEEKRMERAIREHKLMSRRESRGFFLRAMVDSVWSAVRRRPTSGELDDPRWPAHLHINVVPSARGTGAAAGLMEVWFARLRAEGSPGCYLQTLVENVRAVRFFTKMGFTPHGDAPFVPGIRGPEGQKLHQQTMVWAP